MVYRLTPDAGLEEVRRLICGEGSLDYLRGLLTGMVMPGFEAGELKLTRAKYKPGRPLRAFYDIPFSPEVPGRGTTIPVAVVWLPDAEYPEPDQVLLAAAQAIMEKGINQPFARLWHDAPGQGLHLQAWPLDPQFEQLPRLADPIYLQGVISGPGEMQQELTDSGSGHRITGWQVSPVRYRPGERHVLRMHPSKGDASRDVYVKLYRKPADAARAGRITRYAAGLLAGMGGSLEAVRPIFLSEQDAALFYPHAAGVPLSRLLPNPPAGLPGYLERAGSALRAMHIDPGKLSADLESTSLADEVKAVDRATLHVQAFLADLGGPIRGYLDEILALGGRLPEEKATFTHSDFKADHLLVDGERMVLIDFDTCSLADPASDVGKFLADLEWWFLSAGLSGVEEAQKAFLEGYHAGEIPDRLLRARLYQALILMKITARRARIFDADWTDLVTRLVGRAGNILQKVRAGVFTEPV